MQTVVRNIVGGLKSLGLLSPKSMGLPSLNKPIDRHRLSGFLYNISMYLQEMGAELEERQPAFNEEQFWEKILHTFLQSEGGAPYGPWDSRVPPRPSFRLQDLFLSLRGSPHWDGLLGLVQSIQQLSERQPQRPILAFVSQNWKTISALLDVALQAVVSGTYGQASAGLQGFICLLRGRQDCGGFSTGWLEQLLGFLETRNWKPVLSLHPADDPRSGGNGGGGGGGTSVSTGRLRPFSLPPEAILKDEGLASGVFPRNQSMADTEELDSVQALLLQALSRSAAGEKAAVQLAQKNPALLQGLDGLRRGLLHRVGNSVYGSLRRKVSRVTMALLDDVSSVVGVPQPNHHGRCIVGKCICRLMFVVAVV